MNIKFNQTIEVTLNEEQKDCLIIQLLQEIYINAVEDIKTGTETKDSFLSHPDDVKLAKKRAKSAKRLLWYYMANSDFLSFLDSVENGTEYTFSPENYLG